MWANPWTVVFAAVIWVIVGITWAFAKWYFYLKDAKDKISTDKMKELRGLYADPAKTAQFPTFLDYLQDRGYAPTAYKEVDLISVWGAWWPFSMFESAFNDIIRRGWNALVRRYIKTFDAITASVFK